MDRKYLLHTDAIRDTADGKALLDAAVLLGDDGTLEHLDTLTVALLDLQVDTDSVADGHDGGFSLLVLLGKSLH